MKIWGPSSTQAPHPPSPVPPTLPGLASEWLIPLGPQVSWYPLSRRAGPDGAGRPLQRLGGWHRGHWLEWGTSHPRERPLLEDPGLASVCRPWAPGAWSSFIFYWNDGMSVGASVILITACLITASVLTEHRALFPRGVWPLGPLRKG